MPFLKQGWNATNRKYAPEIRERALRMLDEAKPEHPNLMTAVRYAAGLLGTNAETLRVWHRRREIDAGQSPGTPTDIAEENKRLRRENAELRKANEVADSTGRRNTLTVEVFSSGDEVLVCEDV